MFSMPNRLATRSASCSKAICGGAGRLNEDVAALVLTDPDAGAIALSLERFDGTTYEVVGIATHLSEDVGQLKTDSAAPASHAWVPSVDVLDPKDVAFVVLPDANRHRVIDADLSRRLRAASNSRRSPHN